MWKKIAGSLLLGCMMLCMLPQIASAEEKMKKIDRFTFPDENFRKYVTENYDIDKDGNLSESEIAEVITMDISGGEIADLRGLYVFSSLETLDCSNGIVDYIYGMPDSLRVLKCDNNKLFSLEKLSENLEYLSCSGNIIQHLDNLPTGLQSLYCYDNKIFGVLELSHCTDLQYLDAHNNDIVKVVLNENHSVELLDLRNNRIKTPDSVIGVDLADWKTGEKYSMCPQKEQDHAWEIKEVISKASFDMDGEYRYICKACGIEKSVAIPNLSKSKLDYETRAYDGKQKNPDINLVDNTGKRLYGKEYYTISYQSGRTKVGRYAVTVILRGDIYEGSKTFYFMISPEKPQNLKAELYGYDDINLSWSASDKAAGYSIYRYKSSLGNQYEYIGKTKNTWYKMANCKDNTEYSFVVEPYFYLKGDDACYSGEKSKIISVSTMCKLNAPTITKDTADAVEISWRTTIGASGYQLKYRIPETGATRTFNRTGRSMIYNQPKNVTIYYKIRPYKTENGKKIYGPWSEETGFYLGYVGSLKNLQVKLTGYNDVQLSWKKVSGANKYYVYYKRSGMDEFKKLGSTSKLNYSKNNIQAGEKYEFKVLPVFYSDGKVQKKGTEDTIAIYTLKKLNKPEVKKNGTKVIISWNNIDGETGYQISQSTSKTGTKIVTTYATTTGTNKTVSATKGKKFYYKVRAYKTVNGVKVYAPWSEVAIYTRK